MSVISPIFYLRFVCAAVVLFGCVKNNFEYSRSRAGTLRLNDELASTKPLAAADFQGWIAHRDIAFGSISESQLVAYDLKAQKPLWWFSSKDQTIAGPLQILDNHLIVVLRDGSLIKLQIQSGKQSWSNSLDTFAYRKSALCSGVLYTLTASQQLHAISWETGITKWIYDAKYPDGLTMQGSSAPQCVGEGVAIGLSSGELQWINSTTGQAGWQLPADSALSARFRDVVGEIANFKNKALVLARYSGQIQGLDISGGMPRQIWTETLSSVSAAIAHENVFIAASQAGEITAFDAASGKRLWSVAIGSPVAVLYVVNDQLLFAAGTHGRIQAINTKSGRTFWNDEVDARLVTAPFEFNNILYFSTGLRTWYGYRLPE